MIRSYSHSNLFPKLQYRTTQLWEDLVSPLCGILTSIFTYLRQSYDPKGIAIGGQLTDPTVAKKFVGQMIYHIGGMGMNRDDAMIKCLAEAYERYVGVMYDPEKSLPYFYGSYNELSKRYSENFILPFSTFNYFDKSQYSQASFFAPFTQKQNILWVGVSDIANLSRILWAPSHLLFLGYPIKRELGEQRINAAVSTGTAVHSKKDKCILNSLLEIILIDAAIGHWYTDQTAYRIKLDHRTRHILKILQKSIPHNNVHVEFYWIPSKDFPTFNVACITRGDEIPKFAIGLGSDPTLQGAMYKAYLELIGTRLLSNSLAILEENAIDPTNIKNLDDNVLYYALGNGKERLNCKFNPDKDINANDIPDDLTGNPTKIIDNLLRIFSNTGKNAAFVDMSSAESKQLGLVATKIWCPQMITLPLPYAVPINHARFKDYGGVSHNDPHPYP